MRQPASRLRITALTEADPGDGGVKDQVRGYLEGALLLDLWYDGDASIGQQTAGGACAKTAYPRLTGSGIGFALTTPTAAPADTPVFDDFFGAYGGSVTP